MSVIVTMTASPRLLVLLLVALHLQCLYTKYYLVETDGKAASVRRNHIENTKHIASSSKTYNAKAKTGSAKRKGKKTGRARGRNKALTNAGKAIINFK